MFQFTHSRDGGDCLGSGWGTCGGGDQAVRRVQAWQMRASRVLRVCVCVCVVRYGYGTWILGHRYMYSMLDGIWDTAILTWQERDGASERRKVCLD